MVEQLRMAHRPLRRDIAQLGAAIGMLEQAALAAEPVREIVAGLTVGQLAWQIKTRFGALAEGPFPSALDSRAAAASAGRSACSAKSPARASRSPASGCASARATPGRSSLSTSRTPISASPATAPSYPCTPAPNNAPSLGGKAKIHAPQTGVCATG
jgi:hypothetical protein